MAFHFKYEALLKLHKAKLIQEEQNLLTLTSRVAAFRSKLGQLETSHRKAHEALHSNLTLGNAAAILQFSELCDSSIANACKQVRKDMEYAQKQRNVQLLRYRDASRKVEVLENLCDADRSAYEVDAMRREQQTTDELYLAQLSRNRDD
jgi:flagellar export protein FliJ